MAKKPQQLDLETAIRQKAQPGQSYEHQDVFTGELFRSRTPEHYERVDPVPKAPAVDLPRPSLRARIENLINRGGDPLARYIHDGTSDQEYDVPDDPDAPLTASETNYIDMVAAEIAEQAPLPDEDLPRYQQTPSKAPQTAAEGGADEGSPDSPSDDPAPSPASTKPRKSR